jgi:hypothetical protein
MRAAEARAMEAIRAGTTATAVDPAMVLRQE